MIYRADRGWGLKDAAKQSASAYNGVEHLERRLEALERRIETGSH
jgi:3-methyladenine DNA glycosylase AlkD